MEPVLNCDLIHNEEEEWQPRQAIIGLSIRPSLAVADLVALGLAIVSALESRIVAKCEHVHVQLDGR